MQNYEEGRAKLLSLLTEIKRIVGDFDTSTIFEKFEVASAVQEDHQYERSSKDDTHKISALRNISIPVRLSPEIRSERNTSTYVSPATACDDRKVDSDSKLEMESSESGTFALHTPTPSHKLRGFHRSTSNRQSISPLDETGSMVATPTSYRQRRYVNTRNNWLPQQVVNNTVGSHKNEIQHDVDDMSVSSKRPQKIHTPVKSISDFIEELPTNSPVRTLMSKFISNGSPIRSTSEKEHLREIVIDKGLKFQSDDAKARARAKKVVSLLEFVYVGIELNALDGSDFIVESREKDQMMRLDKLQHCDVKLLDHFKLSNCDEEAKCMVESISDYCFPDGVLVDVILRDDVYKYTSPETHSMHIMQFSDVTGTPTYACCLAVTEAYEPKNKEIIRALLLRKRIYSKSVSIIINSFRRFLHKRKIELLNMPKNMGAEISIFDRKHSFYSMSTPFKFRGGMKNNAEVEDGDGGRQQGQGGGLGSVIMSTLKMGISFAGGRTSDKAAPSKTPRVQQNKIKNKLSWMDFNDDDDDDNTDGHSLNRDKKDRSLSTFETGVGRRGRKGKRDSIDSEKKTEEENANDMSWHDDDEDDDEEDDDDEDENNGNDDDKEEGWRSTDSKQLTDSMNSYADSVLHNSAREPFSPFSPNNRMSGTDSRKSSQYSNNPYKEFSPRSCSLTRGDAGVPDRGHCLKDLEGLHLHGFSSESEEETETDDTESSFESDMNNVKTKMSSTEESDVIQALNVGVDVQCLGRARVSPYGVPVSSVNSVQGFNGSNEVQISIQPVTETIGIESQTAPVPVLVPSKVPICEPCMVLEDVDEYVIVTKRALCMLSTTPLHTLSFSLLAALAGEERAAREKNSSVENKKLEKIIICEMTDKAGHVVCDKLEDLLDENLDKIQPQVLPETEVEAEVVMPIVIEEEISPPYMENGISVADSVVQKVPNRRSEDRIYSHRAALLARMTSLSGTGSGTLSGDTVDTSLERGPYLSLIPPNPSTKYFSYNAFQSASLKEWTVAVLLLTLPCDTIMKTLSLLLLESSLIVCAPPSASGLVTAITTAFFLLLKPFEWAGIFVPMLPQNALEVMEAPVPFIVGTIHTPRPANISPAAAVIYLGDYLGPGEDNFLSPACHLNMQKLKLKLRRAEDGEEFISNINKDKKIHGEADIDTDEITDINVHKDEVEEKNEEKNSSKSYPESCTVSSKSLLSAKEGSTAVQSEEEDSLLTSRVKHNEEKKYFYLPAEYCDQSTQGNGDFCFNIPYKNLKYKMQKTKEKLHHMLASNGSMDTEIDGITDPRTHKSADLISISVANKCMKKYIFDMTTKECNTVNSLLISAHGYIAALCGDLTTDCKAWKECGIQNSSSGHFDFYPEMFLDPQRALLDFQVDLAHTQMFVTFVDMKRKEYYSLVDRSSLFLADWLGFRFYFRKRKLFIRK